MALTTSVQDRENFSAGNYRIDDLGDAVIYKNSDILVRPDPIEPGQFLPDDNKLSDYQQQAMNLKSVQQVALCLEAIDRAFWTASTKQIKNGEQATDAKDFVTLDQVVHEEQKLVEYISTDEIPESKTAKYISEDRLFFCPNPKTTQSGNFTIQNSAPPSLISEEKQITNVAFCRSNFIAKNVDIDFTNHKGINCATPSNSNDVVIKSYCDSNSKNSDGTGVITGILGGALGGAIGSILTSSLGQGLAAVGSITGSLAAGTGALATGVLIGGSSDFDRIASGG